jgi:hypothetical protein
LTNNYSIFYYSAINIYMLNLFGVTEMLIKYLEAYNIHQEIIKLLEQQYSYKLLLIQELGAI